jgi:hypothetical protein
MNISIRNQPSLALRRDQPVTCATCGRTVKRKSRRQRCCSARCQNKARWRHRTTRMARSARCTRNLPKNPNAASDLLGQKSRSRLINNAIQTEFFGGGKWERVVSPDGVVTDVTRLWPMRSRVSGRVVCFREDTRKSVVAGSARRTN